VRLDQEQKRKLLKDYKSSGKTQQIFAEENGIKYKTFLKWLSMEKKAAAQDQSGIGFVEVKRPVVQNNQKVLIRKEGIEIEIPSFDITTVNEVLKAMKSL